MIDPFLDAVIVFGTCFVVSGVWGIFYEITRIRRLMEKSE